MTRTVVDCDTCKRADIKSGGEVSIQTGWTEGDPEGLKADYKRFDLCPECLSRLVKRLLTQQCSADYKAILATDLKARRL